LRVRPIRTTALALLVSITGLIAPSTSSVATAAEWLWSAQEPIAPGVTHEQLVAPVGAAEVALNAIRVDADAAGITVETRTAHDAALGAMERLLDQTARSTSEGHRVIAAINGGTFGCFGVDLCSAGGLNVVDGEVYGYRAGALSVGPPVFAITKSREPLIGRPVLGATLTLPDGTTVRIDAVNAPRKDGQTVLYTPRWGTQTWTDDTGLEVVIDGAALPLTVEGAYNGIVSDVRSGVGDAPIGSGSLVISASAETAALLSSVAIGDSVTVRTSIDDGWNRIAYSVSGREQLVRGGSVDIAPVGLDKSTSRHPRSAVGISADGGLILVTADGRQKYTAGATVAEMAQLMVDLGAVDAINLDGGGSTQLAARRAGRYEAEIVNSPSSQSRAIANAIHVVSSAPTSTLADVAIAPGARRVRVGDSVAMTLGGHDAAWNGVPADLGRVTWEASGPAVTVDDAGVVHAVAPGRATVTARAGPWTATASVTAVERVPEVGPPTVSFVAGVHPAQSSVGLRASWTVTPGAHAIERIELQRWTYVSGWRNVALDAPAADSTLLTFYFGRRYILRVRATDASGFVTPWSTADPFRVEPFVPEGSPMIGSPGWTDLSVAEAIRGDVRRSSALGETVAYEMREQPFAIIGQRGRRHGVAQVWVNGEQTASVNLRAPRIRRRQVLYVGQFTQAPSPSMTTIEYRNASTGARTIVDLDEILVIVTLH
jgi:hypothetical protein